MDLRNVIITPIITEKSIADAANSKYTFRVIKKANKALIKKAVEEMFRVNVLDVATGIIKGQTMRVGARRIEVIKPEWKKAIVTIKKDQKIDLFEVGGKK